MFSVLVTSQTDYRPHHRPYGCRLLPSIELVMVGRTRIRAPHVGGGSEARGGQCGREHSVSAAAATPVAARRGRHGRRASTRRIRRRAEEVIVVRDSRSKGDAVWSRPTVTPRLCEHAPDPTRPRPPPPPFSLPPPPSDQKVRPAPRHRPSLHTTSHRHSRTGTAMKPHPHTTSRLNIWDAHTHTLAHPQEAVTPGRAGRQQRHSRHATARDRWVRLRGEPRCEALGRCVVSRRCASTSASDCQRAPPHAITAASAARGPMASTDRGARCDAVLAAPPSPLAGQLDEHFQGLLKMWLAMEIEDFRSGLSGSRLSAHTEQPDGARVALLRVRQARWLRGEEPDRGLHHVAARVGGLCQGREGPDPYHGDQ